MYTRKMMALALAIACYAGHATAQESTAEQLRQINESIAVLTAKQQELELRAQILTKQSEIARITNTDAINIDRVRHPVVQSIEGADGKLVASLAFGSGTQQIVRRGDRIPGGWQVSRIAVDTVHISRGGETVRLAYGHEPPPPLQSPTTVPPLNPLGR